jgi:hypothetical protein
MTNDRESGTAPEGSQLPESALPELPVVAQVVDQQPDYPWRTTIRPRGDLSVGQCQALLPQGTLLCDHATATQALRTANERIAELEHLRKQACECYDRKNPSGCCCKLDPETDEVLSFCGAHQEWKDHATASEARATALEAALRELVAVKMLKDRLITVRSDPYYTTEADRMEAEYARRKPLAWEAARKALAALSAASPEGGEPTNKSEAA